MSVGRLGEQRGVVLPFMLGFVQIEGSRSLAPDTNPPAGDCPGCGSKKLPGCDQEGSLTLPHGYAGCPRRAAHELKYPAKYDAAKNENVYPPGHIKLR